MKAAREEARSTSAREGAIYAQADATRTMVAAQMKKAALLEDQNMLLLMTMLDDKIITVEAREYLHLRRGMSSRNYGGSWLPRRSESALTQLGRMQKAAHIRPQNAATRGKVATTSTKGWVHSVAA